MGIPLILKIVVFLRNQVIKNAGQKLLGNDEEIRDKRIALLNISMP